MSAPPSSSTATTSSVSSVYVAVIDDVISKVRDEFISYGVGDSVLTELQTLWEMKMMQCGVISSTSDRAAAAAARNAAAAGAVTGIQPVHDLNVPYDGAEEYATPTAEMLFPPTPQQTPIQTPLPDGIMYSIPTGPSDFAPSPLIASPNGVGELKAGRPNAYMQPPSPWMHQRPLAVDVNVAYVEGREETDRGAPSQPLTKDFLLSSGKRKRDDYPSRLASTGYMPQQDGSADVTFGIPYSKEIRDEDQALYNNDNDAIYKESWREIGAPVLPQKDGIHDEFNELYHYQGLPDEDYNTVNTPGVEYQAPTPSVGTPRPVRADTGDEDDGDDDDDEPPLNEDDDDVDELDELGRGEEEPSTQHLVLAQFDKVTRTKNRWKCTLKDGIMHINGKDVLFNKAMGEFDF